MIKRSIPVILLGAIIGFSACNEKGGFKTVDGLEYNIVKDAPGDKKPAVGDIIEVHLRMSIDDSLMADTRKENANKPVQVPLQEPMFKGDWWTGVKMLTPGDSAIFLVSVDSVVNMIKKQPGGQVPPLLEGKKKIKYEVVLVSIKSQAEMQKEMDAKNSVQAATDDKIITDYLTKNNIQATKTASGLYYKIEQEGTGETIKPGQKASVKYIGTTLEGKVFDANMGPEAKRTEAFELVVGQGGVIRGWDEGLQLLKKGSKAKLFIPSPLAYGPQQAGPDVPPNSVLIFDVQVEDVK